MGIVIVLVDGADGAPLANEEQPLAIMGGRQIRARPSRNGSNDGTALENDLLAGIQVGNRDRGLKLADARNRNGRLLLGVVIVLLLRPVVNFGEKLRRDAAATLQRADLGMIDGNLEGVRSEEHTSELQSHSDLVCRLLLEKKK